MNQSKADIKALEKELAAKKRELKIEKAFEKVRAHAMSMRLSSDLQKIVNIVAQELNNMNLDITGVFMVINNDEIDKQFTFWGSTGVAEIYMKKAAIPFLDRPIYRVLAEATTKGEHFFTEEYTREEKNEFFEHLFKFPPYSSSTPEWKEQVFSREGGYTRSVSVSHYTSIFVVNHFGRRLSDADNKILRRFGKVFEQSYTRFLDIQKAEALAREAIKQASADRVRGEIASMRTSEDLNRITPIIWRELETLEVPFIRCGVFIIDNENEKIQAYLTTPDGKSLAALNLAFDTNYLTNNAIKYWKENQIYKERWNREKFINWTKSMIKIGQIQNVETYQGSSVPPESLHLHFVPFAQGILYVGNVSTLTDEKLELVKTLAEAFSMAYARYEDFKNVEEAKNKIEITLNELKIAQAQLKELDELKSRFFANISHEFRTPLTLIMGEVENVLASNIHSADKKKLEIANINANKLLVLINQLLELSKIDAGNLELKSENGNLVSFLKNIFFSFESFSSSKNVLLHFYSETENISLAFDHEKMETIFYNLLSNAFKFTEGPGEISLAIKVIESAKIEIILKDTGIGIPPEQIPHIFNRFFQADSSTIRKHEGTGIGLALVKELVELHKGKISVSSLENEGTEFRILLPLSFEQTMSASGKNITVKTAEKQTSFKPEAQPAIQSERGDKTESENHKKIILVVEDNPEVREYIKEQLVNSYRIKEAENGEEGLLAAEDQLPDLIITDVMMPRMDGYEFCLKLRRNEKTSHIPIVMLTAKAGFDDKINGLETGIDAFVTKPFSAKELKIRIKNLIAQREQLRKRFSKSTIIRPTEVSAISADQRFLKKTLKLIESNFHDENFSVELLADKINMSVSQLNRKLNALIDQPAGQLIRSLRLQRAADLLKQNSASVSEICYNLGFSDLSYFSRAFKKQFGRTPTEYREK
ncbi:ATP-binding protein [Draconibacterium halophilum]|uniref:histidine kinase n=1 Tax=Draconibacterium halophilum TaxID=2706887 RepID=A0A6C0RGK0_9BACT|nr:ATP-binding protein [Draconibacterium halophilum]QIA09644.1 response regulator [Draconibacterium halophilum]